MTESIDPFFVFKSCTILFSCAATVAALPVVVVTFVAVVLLVDDDDDDEIVLAIVLMIEAFLKRNVEPMEVEVEFVVVVAVAVGVTGVVAVGEFVTVAAVGSPLTKITRASDSTNKSHSTGSSFTMYRTMV